MKHVLMIIMSGTFLLFTSMGLNLAEANNSFLLSEEGMAKDSGQQTGTVIVAQREGTRQTPLGDLKGRAIGGTQDPVGFTCNAATKTCTCRMSTVGDCKLMKALVCGGTFDCPGSSQTCTCKARK
jgi:hypothetical protein